MQAAANVGIANTVNILDSDSPMVKRVNNNTEKNAANPTRPRVIENCSTFSKGISQKQANNKLMPTTSPNILKPVLPKKSNKLLVIAVRGKGNINIASDAIIGDVSAHFSPNITGQNCGATNQIPTIQGTTNI